MRGTCSGYTAAVGEGYKQHCGNAVRLLPPQPFYFTEDLSMEKYTGDSRNEIMWFSDLLKEMEAFLNERNATMSPDEVHIVFDPRTGEYPPRAKRRR
jgi:hypothetical protein